MPFRTLSRDRLFWVAASRDVQLRESFVDALAILHEAVTHQGGLYSVRTLPDRTYGDVLLEAARGRMARLRHSVVGLRSQEELTDLEANIAGNVEAVRVLATFDRSGSSGEVVELRREADRVARVIASQVELIESAPVWDEDLQVAVGEALTSFDLAEGPSASLADLAREYESLRTSKSRGFARTRGMEQIVVRMRAAWPAVKGEFEAMRSSESAGERLAAVVYLQDTPSRSYIAWLAERIGREQPFVEYQAIIGLESAVVALSGAERGTVNRALQDVVNTLETRQQHRTDRYARAVSALRMSEAQS